MVAWFPLVFAGAREVYIRRSPALQHVQYDLHMWRVSCLVLVWIAWCWFLTDCLLSVDLSLFFTHCCNYAEILPAREAFLHLTSLPFPDFPNITHTHKSYFSFRKFQYFFFLFASPCLFLHVFSTCTVY